MGVCSRAPLQKHRRSRNKKKTFNALIHLNIYVENSRIKFNVHTQLKNVSDLCDAEAAVGIVAKC